LKGISLPDEDDDDEPSLQLRVGDTIQLDNLATPVPAEAELPGVKWSVQSTSPDNADVVTVGESSGKVEAKTVGTATITATVTTDEGEKSATCTVEVKAAAEDEQATVTFQVDGKEYATSKVQKDAETLWDAWPWFNPKKAGCEFAGWSKSEDEDAELISTVEDANKVTISGDSTYEAVFTGKINFYDDGGLVSTDEVTDPVRYGTDVTAPGAKEREGATFLGWATCANASTAEVKAGDKVTCTGDATYYAIYKTNMMKYTLKGDNVTYIANDLKKNEDGDRITDPWTAEDDGSHIGYQRYDKDGKQTIEFKVEDNCIITGIKVKDGNSAATDYTPAQIQAAIRKGYIEVDCTQNHEITITAKEEKLVIAPTTTYEDKLVEVDKVTDADKTVDTVYRVTEAVGDSVTMGSMLDFSDNVGDTEAPAYKIEVSVENMNDKGKYYSVNPGTLPVIANQTYVLRFRLWINGVQWEEKLIKIYTTPAENS
jgi:hypothetical protein